MSTHGSTLGDKAFGDQADPGLIVAYASHQDAMRFLSASLSQRNGIALLEGPGGAGKTTIVRQQHDWSGRDAAAALIDGIHLTPRHLLMGMLTQFGIDTIPQADEQMLRVVNNFLSRQTEAGPAPVLIVDNFDRATSSTQRMLNWLAALEVRGRYALRIVLTGRERLEQIVHADSMRDIGRRRPATYSLNPLSDREVMIYLRTRLIAAGGERSEKVFPIRVCAKLHELSQGWPGRLNTCALQAMERMTELKTGRPVPRVILTSDGETRGEYELTQQQYVIGRSELADIVIEDSYVSKLHAMLQVYANAIVMLDLNSTNGTLVNARETPRTILRSNDVISIGRHRLKVENAPRISSEMDARIRAADTHVLENLVDIRRQRARHTIAAMKHK